MAFLAKQPICFYDSVTSTYIFVYPGNGSTKVKYDPNDPYGPFECKECPARNECDHIQFITQYILVKDALPKCLLCYQSIHDEKQIQCSSCHQSYHQPCCNYMCKYYNSSFFICPNNCPRLVYNELGRYVT